METGKRFSKRYIAAGALALLVAAGGTTGALIAAQSTIADNVIHAGGSPEAVVTATGDPLNMHVARQDSYNLLPYGEARIAPYTLTNIGNATATVKLNINEKFAIDTVETTKKWFAWTGLTDLPITIEDLQADGRPSGGGWSTADSKEAAYPINRLTVELKPGESKIVSLVAAVPRAYLDDPTSKGAKVTFDLAVDCITKSE